MNMSFRYGRDNLSLNLPDDAIIYASGFPDPPSTPEDIVLNALMHPVGMPPLEQALRMRKSGQVVIVVSDITRPIPYSRFLTAFLAKLEHFGVKRDEILILIATGMHRPSSPEERIEMFGEAAGKYPIIDHQYDNDRALTKLPQKSYSGATIYLNRHFMEAGFKIITGLVEPHFMAGFSGGRKAVCPGLASLDTIERFHGYEFLSHPMAKNGQLRNNPCHEEAVSVAQMAGVDFSLNIVLNSNRDVVQAFAGDLTEAHEHACEFVRIYACPEVKEEADIVLTSSGGYPLDATFYQCVKGFVSCLPAVKEAGTIIAFGKCSEGIGSETYTNLLKQYSGQWEQFLEDIQKSGVFTHDQWEFQMQTHTLQKVGQNHLHFVTDGIDSDTLASLSVHGHAAHPEAVNQVVQDLLDRTIQHDKSVAVFPEGPYCAPWI